MSKRSTVTEDNWTLLRQEFLARWKKSVILHSVLPAASVLFHSSSGGSASRSQQAWGWVITEATHLVHFVLSNYLPSGCLNMEWHHKKIEQEPDHAVSTLSAMLLIVRRTVLAVIFLDIVKYTPISRQGPKYAHTAIGKVLQEMFCMWSAPCPVLGNVAVNTHP
jgi:hypothetical protein